MADNVDKVKAMLNAEPASVRLRKLPTNTPIYENLSGFLSKPSTAFLDVSTKLIVGLQCAGGAYSDVFIGELLVSELDESAIKPILDNQEALGVYLEQNPMTFKTVAVKRIRYFLFLNDVGAKVRHCQYPVEVSLIYHMDHEVAFARATCLVQLRPS